MTRLLCVIDRASGEVVEAMDLTADTDSGARQVRTGVRIQMDTQNYRLEELVGDAMVCRHCGNEVEDTGDGFHFLHTEGPGSNSKYCEPNSPTNNDALRSLRDVTVRTA